MIEDARGRIDYDEEGSGPTILFVPGSWATRSAWRGVVAALDGRFRKVTMSLLGYGGTEERRTATAPSIEREAEIVEAAVGRTGGPVHLVGHSHGGLVSLAVAIRGVAPLASLTLVEPVAFGLLHQADDHALYQHVMTVRDGYFRAFEDGDKEAARRVIDFFGGSGSFDALPARMRDYVVATTATNILDWHSELNVPLSAYSGIGVPSLVVRGGRGHQCVARTAEILSGAMPKASLVTVPAASHFMIATHAGAVARLIGDHVSKAEPLM